MRIKTGNEKKKIMQKRVIAVVMTAALIAVSSFGVYSFAAEGKTVKSVQSDNETVYIMTDNTGKEHQRIVSEKGNLHYDGYEDAVLPVSVDIKYALDGTEVAPEELEDKTGHLKMTLKYNSNYIDGIGNIPFLAISGIAGSTSTLSDVTVDHGKVIEDGDRCMIITYGLPGVTENLGSAGIDEISDTVVIEAEADNFIPENIYTFATKELFEDISIGNKFNAEGILDQMEELCGGINKVNEGAAALKTGLDTLNDGAGQMKSGTGQLAAGATDLAAGLQNLSEGSEGLAAGAGNLAEASEQLAAGSSMLTEKTGELSAGLTALSANSAAIKAGADQLVNGAFASAGAQLGTTLTQENYTAVIDGMKAAAPAMSAQLDSVKNSLAGALMFRQGLYEYTDGVDTAALGAGAVSDKLTTEFNPGMTQLAQGAAALNAGHSNFGNGIGQLNAGAVQLAAGTGELDARVQEMLGGIKLLRDGAVQLEDGTALMNEKVNGEINQIYGNSLFETLKKVKNLRGTAKEYKYFGENGDYDKINFVFKTELTEENK